MCAVYGSSRYQRQALQERDNGSGGAGGRGRGLMGVWAGVGVSLGVDFHVIASRAGGVGASE